MIISELKVSTMDKFIGRDKFIVKGHLSNTCKAKFSLNLPRAKLFSHVAVKNCESKVFPAELIAEAVTRRLKPLWNSEKSHNLPRAIIDGVSIDFPKTLQQILCNHPYPLNQGPIVLPIDTNTESKKVCT